MTLRLQQELFLQDVAKLIVFIFSTGFTATGGELYRPDEMQKIYFDSGLSNVKSGGSPSYPCSVFSTENMNLLLARLLLRLFLKMLYLGSFNLLLTLSFLAFQTIALT